MTRAREVITASLERLKNERDRADADRQQAQARVDGFLAQIGQATDPMTDAQRKDLAAARAALWKAEEHHAAAYKAYMSLVNLVLSGG